MLENIKKLLKAHKPSLPSIEELTEKEKLELEKLGISFNGLFHEIEPEVVEIAQLYSEFYNRRYEEYGKQLMIENPETFKKAVEEGRWNSDGTVSEKRKRQNFRMGLTHKAFEIALQQIQIPYVPNDPTIDWRPEAKIRKKTKVRYDFYIPLLGSIDIKSATFENPVVNINCEDFNQENPDFVVAYQILDELKPKWLWLSGFLANLEIKENYEPKRKWEPSRAYWKIPIEDFKKHDGFELCEKVLAVKMALKELE